MSGRIRTHQCSNGISSRQQLVSARESTLRRQVNKKRLWTCQKIKDKSTIYRLPLWQRISFLESRKHFFRQPTALTTLPDDSPFCNYKLFFFSVFRVPRTGIPSPTTGSIYGSTPKDCRHLKWLNPRIVVTRASELHRFGNCGRNVLHMI
jgi:hypothetical protein